MLIDKIRNSKIDEDLNQIARCIREKMIQITAETGGHLASSLGVVELTVALHKVFDSPTDSMIWDVGHQAYAHKIITGRDDDFKTLRQQGGLSGFPKRSESEHDPFGTGHSSTSISAALGIAEAKRISGETGKVIAVIGDGALTAGLSHEGLNNAGHVMNKRLVVVFNDNQMSIDRNVGALSNFMNKGLTNPTYNRIRRDLSVLLDILSMKDLKLVEMSRKAAAAVKDFFLAGSLFEAFGFRYIGPIDGHDIDGLIETLDKISQNIDREVEGVRPVLLHVITKKGKGYKPAEDNPSSFHGTPPFDIDSGAVLKRSTTATYTSVFGDTVCEVMQGDGRTVAITAAMPSGTGLDKVRARFPGRYYDVGIAESHAVVFAAGMASKGFIPIVAIYSSFLQRAYDAVVHDVCLQNLPVIFALDRAGAVGEDGPTHHGMFDICYLRHIPNMVIMAPSDEEELRKMIWSARVYRRPVAIRYPRGAALGVKLGSGPVDIPLGKSRIALDCDMPEYAFFAVGNMVKVAIDAAKKLGETGVNVTVIDARFIKPLDSECILNQASQNRKIVTIEDGALMGGFGSAVLELLSENGISDIEVMRFGYDDEFVEHGSIAQLHMKHGLTSEQIVDRILSDSGERSVRKPSAVNMYPRSI